MDGMCCHHSCCEPIVTFSRQQQSNAGLRLWRHSRVGIHHYLITPPLFPSSFSISHLRRGKCFDLSCSCCCCCCWSCHVVSWLPGCGCGGDPVLAGCQLQVQLKAPALGLERGLTGLLSRGFQLASWFSLRGWMLGRAAITHCHCLMTGSMDISRIKCYVETVDSVPR